MWPGQSAIAHNPSHSTVGFQPMEPLKNAVSAMADSLGHGTSRASQWPPVRSGRPRYPAPKDEQFATHHRIDNVVELPGMQDRMAYSGFEAGSSQGGGN